MAIKTLRHRLLYVKDSLQGTIYAALSKTSWLTGLSSVLALAVRPLLGMTLTTLALLQLWTFIHTSNKNLDAWMSTVSSLGGAVLNNVAAFGGFIAKVTGTAFVVAPWFFVAGFTVSAFYQLVMSGINFRRAYEAPAQSHQRQHSIQAAAFNLISGIQLASCAAAIVLFNVAPALGLVVTALALTVVAINIGNCLWRFISSDTKKEIKNVIGIGKPVKDLSHQSIQVNKSNEQHRHPTKNLFTTVDHCAIIKEMHIAERKKYLDSYLTKKLNNLTLREPSEKNLQKIAVLTQLKYAVSENTQVPEKGKLHKKYPRIVENFWCEKSDTDQLIDAVIYYSHSLHERQKVQTIEMVPLN